MAYRWREESKFCIEIVLNSNTPSGVARAFPGGRLAHPESQNEEENEKSLREKQEKWSKFAGKMRKVELLPTRDCEAGYGPEYPLLYIDHFKVINYACSHTQKTKQYHV